MTSPKTVNIGTKESPVYVPEAEVKPGTVKGDQFWSRVATGSQNLPSGEVFKLIEKPNEYKAKKG